MFAKQIDLQEKETTVEELLALIEDGSEVILTKGETPVARVLPIKELPKKERSPGMHPNSIWMSDDFNDPLPDEFWFGDE
jgi:antitoxin (DNA-binding transcriptional repressor) of toxin-antitoxin stability system